MKLYLVFSIAITEWFVDLIVDLFLVNITRRPNEQKYDFTKSFYNFCLNPLLIVYIMWYLKEL